MPSRVDDRGRAYKRSQLQIQIAINRRRRELEAQLFDALPSLQALDPALDWRSPLEEDRFREYWDGVLLKRIGRSDLKVQLKAFWPTRGPHWDAVAVARTKAGGWLGPVLMEAKSYPAETRSRCAADGERKQRIERRLAETRRWLGVSDHHAACWIDERYQAANRLTFVRWFHEVLGERAWLANVYVVDDPDPAIATTKRQWLKAIEEDKRCLGVAETEIRDAGAVFIRGRQRSEVLDS